MNCEVDDINDLSAVDAEIMQCLDTWILRIGDTIRIVPFKG